MYIDASRLKDLEMLKTLMEDYTKPMKARQVASRTHDKIMREIKDPVVSKLRERLVKATYAEDKKEIWKISNQIRAHLKEEMLEEGTN